MDRNTHLILDGVEYLVTPHFKKEVFAKLREQGFHKDGVKTKPAAAVIHGIVISELDAQGVSDVRKALTEHLKTLG